MSAATTAIRHRQHGIETLRVPLKAGAKLYDGAMVSVLTTGAATGFAVAAASEGTAQKVIGLTRIPFDGTDAVDNAAGAHGDLLANVETEPHWVAQNGTITAAHLLLPCYAADDATVALTGTHVAGLIMAVEAGQVLVDFLRKSL